MTSSLDFMYLQLFSELNTKAPVSEKVQSLHKVVRQRYDFIHRVGVAVYDSEFDLLKTFAHSTDTGNPLPHYSAKLTQATSLYQVHLDRSPRVVNDLSVFNESEHPHAKQINSHGYRSSYTVPIYQNEKLLGFIFFNSRQSDVFQADCLTYLDLISRIISLLVTKELDHAQTLQGALKTATAFSSHRDPETGAHLERMARFSRLIANELASDYGWDDEYVERLFWCAPMHDIGKIAIPDQILLKPGKLTSDEFELMKEHTTKGRELIETMNDNFKFEGAACGNMLRQIVESHHENMDGSGYPNGLKGDEIPIEARIIAVADVFDALTSERPYKQAWSNEDAFAELMALTAWKLDRRCVDALIKNRRIVEEIQDTFKDEQAEKLQEIAS